MRYSSANQTEQSIEGQIRVCRDFCNRHNIRVVEVYVDRATSASKDIEKRVQFLKMIKDSEKHQFDAVIVYKLDRFSRSRYDSANYKYKLKKNGVQLISGTENISNDPEGIILESVLAGMAEFYSAELSQKINRGLPISITLWAVRPDIPVIFASMADYCQGKEMHEARRAVIIRTYDNAVTASDQNVYFVDGNDIYKDVGIDFCIVDDTHPNDLGFWCMSKAYGRVIEQILNEIK